jgi:hypothetical protein
MPRSVAAVAFVVLLLAGCGGDDGDSSSTATSKPDKPRGKVTVVYDEPPDAETQRVKELLKVGGFDGVAAGFTKSFVLPRDIEIRVVNGTEGPYYDPSEKAITYSYGFADYVARVLLTNFPGLEGAQGELGKQWAAINDFILIHEWAHALIDVYELPVLGREEDAADALATVFMTDFVDGGSEYAFDAARFFDALSARQRKLAPADYWDEHSLDKQRAYTIVCQIAGADEHDYKVIEQAGILGPERLRRCPSEYQQKAESWKRLLEPHLSRG